MADSVVVALGDATWCRGMAGEHVPLTSTYVRSGETCSVYQRTIRFHERATTEKLKGFGGLLFAVFCSNFI